MATKKPTERFPGMEEMYTSPREKDDKIVKNILRRNHIPYRSSEEKREHGWRFCIYTPKKRSNEIYKLLDEELSERGM